MKRFVFIILGLACVLVVAQTDPVQNEVQEVLISRVTTAPGQSFDLKPLKALHHALAGGRPNIWLMTPGMRKPIQQSVEPLRDIAKQLAESGQSAERYYGAVLNSYLQQTDETRALLLKLAHDDDKSTAATSMYALFGLKLDTPELREELVQAMQEDKPPRERSTMYGLAVTNVGNWGVIEVLPVLMRQLESSSDGSVPVDRNAVRQIKALGPRAADALPLLRQLSEQRRAAGNADFRELEDLDHAVLVVSGEYKAPQGFPPQSPPASAPPESPPPSSKKAPDAQSLPSTPVEESPSPTRWPLVAAVVVAALGLLWLLLKKRK